MNSCRYFQTTAIIFALVFANSAPAYCKSPQNNQTPSSQVQSVKDQVKKIGIAEDVTVTLFSGVEYHGAISKIEPDSFEIAEVDMKQMVTISYKDVKNVREGFGQKNSSDKRNGRLISRTGLIIIIVGVGAIVGIILGFRKSRNKPASPFPQIP